MTGLCPWRAELHGSNWHGTNRKILSFDGSSNSFARKSLTYAVFAQTDGAKSEVRPLFLTLQEKDFNNLRSYSDRSGFGSIGMDSRTRCYSTDSDKSVRSFADRVSAAVGNDTALRSVECFCRF